MKTVTPTPPRYRPLFVVVFVWVLKAFRLGYNMRNGMSHVNVYHVSQMVVVYGLIASVLCKHI